MPRKLIRHYEHADKERVNNPPVGLVTEAADRDAGKKKYRYDPHIDPSLQFDCQGSEIERIVDDGLAAAGLDDAREALAELKKRRRPYLNWAGKAERTAFEVPTVSLHVHERIEPRTIIEAIRRRESDASRQISFFEQAVENPPLRQAVEFYKHKHGWSNRLIAGDSLLVMNSLLEKEGMAGQVQMVYFDPPYGIKYGSNFQPFVDKRDVKDGNDEDLTREPEMLKAFRDTWQLGIHSYLTYLRDRLLVCRDLLRESGSIFVQINDENLHLVRCLMDEVFGRENYCMTIQFQKTGQSTSGLPPTVCDYLLWYARNRREMRVHRLFRDKLDVEKLSKDYAHRDERGLFRLVPLNSQHYSRTRTVHVQIAGRRFWPGDDRQWSTDPERLPLLHEVEFVVPRGNALFYKMYAEWQPVISLTNLWDDTARGDFGGRLIYVVQTNPKVVERCILMTTNPGDLVFDPTCGSGTTAYCAEKWGRRWITCDTSRVAVAIAKQRLMTAAFDYYELAHPEEGVASGFKHKTVPYITLEAIAGNLEIDTIAEEYRPRLQNALSSLNRALGTGWKEWEVPRPISCSSSSLAQDVPAADWPEAAKEAFFSFWRLKSERREKIDESIRRCAKQEALYDQPNVDRNKARVTGPFTVEAVPAPTVRGIDEVMQAQNPAADDLSLSRSGETLRQAEWRDELLKAGIRGRGGEKIEFCRVEPLAGTRWLHADAETKDGRRVVVSFGPEHAPLEQRQVELALEEAQNLVPRPRLVVFAAFHFDPEAAKDIDETNWPGVTLLKAQMNADLLTEDLKKKKTGNESFWLIGQPDVQLHRLPDGKLRVEVCGFDYYDPGTGLVESGGPEKIAMWMLDPNYDGRSLFPRQVFFPMAGDEGGWSRLARTLRAEIDPDLAGAYGGTVSLPFEPGSYRRVAVKIIDDRGIESLTILEVR